MRKKIKIYSDNFDSRTKKALLNIISIFFIRFFGVLISFSLIPLTIKYVNSESYGIWLTLSSIIGWMSFMDIGLNNGLRNKLTISLSQNNLILSKEYISTTYALLIIIFIPLLIILNIFNYYADWNGLLNINPNIVTNKELKLTVAIIVSYFCFKFILSTINVITLSNLKPANVSLRGLFEQVISLLSILILKELTEGSLLKLTISLCILPLIVLLFFNYWLFRKTYKNISPDFKSIDFKLSKDLFSLGFKFFIIQISGIIQFQTANFIIIKFFNPEDVTIYNIVFKYFGVLTLLMSIFTTPIWSSVTDAYVKGEFNWIRNTVNKFKNLSFLLMLIGFLMLIFSDLLIKIWIGDSIIFIPTKVLILTYIFTCLGIWGSIYSSVLNGIGALKIQFFACIIAPFIFVFSAYFCIKFINLGLESIMIASIVSNFNGYILGPLQYNYHLGKYKK